uniref:Myb/SANT-like DNA-binding domain-containing protein n=1 Tax=Cyprinus carpio TaxID=7962 RepID=A0A8C2H5W4_CYPCA
MAESWSVDEVQTFLSLVAEERIQRELDGATRNEKVFQEVAQLLAAHGYHRTYKQCRDKLKKLKSDYRAIKDHNSRSGANRRTWKWFDQMDAIYGSRPASNGREGFDLCCCNLCINKHCTNFLFQMHCLRLTR